MDAAMTNRGAMKSRAAMEDHGSAARAVLEERGSTGALPASLQRSDAPFVDSAQRSEAPSIDTEISRSLGPLREVVTALSAAEGGWQPGPKERQRLVRRARLAGTAVLPALLRALQSSGTEAELGAYLLRRLGCERVVPRLHAMLKDGGITDDTKARVLGLLADLKAPPPQQVVLRDPDGLLQNSVHDLVSNLGSRTEVRQAVEMLLQQVPGPEIVTFVAEVLEHGGGAAWPLIDALCTDRRTPPGVAHEVAEMARRAGRWRRPRDRQSLERALSLLQEGKPAQARKRLDFLATVNPDDAEIRSALGVCLLEMNQAEGAVPHLQRAAELEPTSSLHLWNLAAAARAAERMGICYKTLNDYLRMRDSTAGAADRAREARAFCHAYESMLREAYPGVPLDVVLRGEEIFAGGYAALSASRYDEATLRFHEVLKLVPRHYPSWGNLGAAYLALDRTDDAARCLRRALELNPHYSIARENLALLEQQA